MRSIPSPMSLFAKIPGFPRPAFQIKENLGLLEGLNGLEERYGKFWDDMTCANNAERAIAVLKNYTDRLFARNRTEVKILISEIREHETIDAYVVARIQNLYRILDNGEGTTARRLSYILLQNSGLYTSERRAEIKERNDAERTEASSSCPEQYPMTCLFIC